MSETKTIAIGSVLFVALVALIGLSYFLPSPEEETPEVAIELPNVFENVALTGRAAVVYDLKNNEVLYGKAEEAQLPLASVTKLLTAYTATEVLGENKYIQIRPEDLLPDGDSGLLVSENWKAGDLARFSLIGSSNDASEALARALSENRGHAAAAILSQAAQELSLAQTFALNGSGLDTNRSTSGGYGSAKDVALLLGEIYENNRTLLLDSSKPSGAFTSAEGFQHIASTTNELAISLPQLVGAKTGFTDLAGGNLAVLIEVAPGRPVAIVVLGSTRENRFSDVENLVDTTLQHFTYAP